MRIKARVFAILAALWLVPSLGCIDDYPYHSPQAPSTYGATEARAFSSGEASTTAMGQASQDLPDVGATSEDVVVSTDVSQLPSEDIQF